MEVVISEGLPRSIASDPQPRKSGFRRVRQLLTIGLILGLSAMNVATVLSNTVHGLAFDAVKGVAAAFPTDIAARLLANSTESMINRAVAERTAALSAELNEVELKHKNLERAHWDLGTKHSALKKTHVELEAKHAELARVSARRAEAVRTFSNNLGARTVRNVSRNVASVPGEAIPYLGTALLLGVTSWDIYDACQTIKELNVVNVEFANEPVDDQRVCGMKVPSKAEVVSQIKDNWREAYATAARALSVPSTLPSPSWHDLKDTVCPVIGSPRFVCD